jgi:hypothetical protein
MAAAAGSALRAPTPTAASSDWVAKMEAMEEKRRWAARQRA